jgi:hypothetical protein
MITATDTAPPPTGFHALAPNQDEVSLVGCTDFRIFFQFAVQHTFSPELDPPFGEVGSNRGDLATPQTVHLEYFSSFPGTI